MTAENNINEIINKYIPLAKQIAFNLSKKYNMNSDELTSYAYLGLCEIVNKYDQERLSERFLYKKIYDSVLTGILKENNIPTSPTHEWIYIFMFIKKYENRLGIDLAKNPDTLKKIIEIMIQQGKIKILKKENVNEFFLKNKTTSLEEINIIDTGGIDLNKYFIEKYFKDLLKELPSNYREILILRFGIDKRGPMTLKEIAKIFNISTENVRQKIKIALETLRKISKTNKTLVNYCEELEDKYINYGPISNQNKNSIK